MLVAIISLLAQSAACQGANQPLSSEAQAISPPSLSKDEASSPPFPCPLLSYSDPSLYGSDGLPTFRPLIIAHRGASGMFPEHTAVAYREAARQGADLIECDLAITKDRKFICVHEPYLGLTTDVASKPEFASRRLTYNMDDDDPLVDWNDKGDVTDWFSFDFTLDELRTLRKRQVNEFRDPDYDWKETIVTLEELVSITREEGEKQGRTIGVYPELKHSSAVNKVFADRGVEERFEDLALQELQRLGLNSSSDPVFLQSFEISSLEYVKDKTELKLVFLTERNLTNSDWERLNRLELAGVGVDKGGLVTPGRPDSEGRGRRRWGEKPTDFIQQVHQHGLKAHCFTFRNEWMKLYWESGQDPYSELEEHLALGVDGFFTDFPLTARRFLNYKGILCGEPSNSCHPPILT